MFTLDFSTVLLLVDQLAILKIVQLVLAAKVNFLDFDGRFDNDL